MRLPTASEYKRARGKGGAGPPTQREPTPGSFLRDVYDLFMNNQGKLVPIHKPVDKKAADRVRSCFTQLEDYYGLDIRKVRPGYTIGGPTLYYLAGYWNGKDYVDLRHLLDTELLVKNPKLRE